MSEREALRELAQLVSVIAARCWEGLGTTEVARIVQRCKAIYDAMEPES